MKERTGRRLVPTGQRLRISVAGARRMSLTPARKRWRKQPKFVASVAVFVTSVVVVPASTVITLVLTGQELALNTGRQLADTYAQVDSQLVSDEPYLRTVGIETLQRVAQDEPAERPVVLARLASFVRAAAPAASSSCTAERYPAQEVVDAVTAIGRLNTGDHEVDLTYTCLTNLNLPALDFENADFSGALLDSASFLSTNLRNSDFGFTNLTDVIFADVDLRMASFCYANLDDTRFLGGNVTAASIPVYADSALLAELQRAGASTCMDGSLLADPIY
jgi:hypothetical protein